MIKGYQRVSKVLAYPVLFSPIMIQASAEGKKVPEEQCQELKGQQSLRVENTNSILRMLIGRKDSQGHPLSHKLLSWKSG